MYVIFLQVNLRLGGVTLLAKFSQNLTTTKKESKLQGSVSRGSENGLKNGLQKLGIMPCSQQVIENWCVNTTRTCCILFVVPKRKGHSATGFWDKGHEASKTEFSFISPLWLGKFQKNSLYDFSNFGPEMLVCLGNF